MYLHNKNKISWLLLFLLGLIWGGSFFSVSLALESFSPIQVAAMRILFGALILFSISVFLGSNLPSLERGKRIIWFYCLGMAIFTNALPFSLLSWAQTQVSSSFAGLSMAIIPLMVLPLAYFFVKNETITRTKLVGFCIGFLGVCFLFEVDLIILEVSKSGSLHAKIACLVAAFSYAIGSIITRNTPETSKLAFSTASLILATLIIMPIAFWGSAVPESFSKSSLLGILYLGALPTGLATFILVFLIKTAGPSFLSLVNYQVPIWAVVFGIFLNAEVLPQKFFVALIIIFLGLFITERDSILFEIRKRIK